MKVIIGLIFLLALLDSFSQEGKKVQFIGGARSLISQTGFSSDDSDTVTPRKSTGGYALIDLGIKINPNSNTEILGMMRIKNDFGGFWGGGVTFDVRQIQVKGVAGNVVRYQIGNIDYKLSPYTFYNHNPDLLVSSFSTNRIKEDVLNYESFYKNNNTWRQQGAAADFALKFPKGIKEMKFNGFITRLNPTNFTNILERFFGGGNVVVNQSKYLTLGVNQVSTFDLKQTALTDNAYRNNVTSLTYDASWTNDKIKIGIDGESGFSSSYSTQNMEGKLSDYFVHVKGTAQLKKLGLNVKLGYMDNGPDFRSFGAQSKRMDFNQVNGFYERYTNEQIIRPLSYYDLYNDPSLYSAGISTRIMAINPAINNVLPYGVATFNRRGIYMCSSFSDKKKIVSIDATYYRLQEIRGQGTFQLRTFHYLNTTLKIDFSNWLKWKKKQVFQLGLAYQKTNRKSEFDFETIRLNSLTANAGFEFEIVENLSVLGNAFLFQSSGNETEAVRNASGEIVNFNQMTIDGIENNFSGGIKFSFTKDVYLAAFFESNSNSYNLAAPYRLNQLMIYYIMKF